MSGDNDIAITARDYENAGHKLRDLVTTIEFTMVSIIAGLMLFPWIDQAVQVVRDLDLESWYYLAIMLVLIMFYWTAMTVHALTFVGWPIDITHNLIYLLVFPIVAVSVEFIGEPGYFYPTLAVSVLGGVLLEAYDLSLIRARLKEARGAEAELYAAVCARQLTLTRINVLGLVTIIIFAFIVNLFPDLLIGRHLHVALAILSLLFVCFLLVREITELNRMRGLMLKRMAEEVARERVEWSRLARSEAVSKPPV